MERKQEKICVIISILNFCCKFSSISIFVFCSQTHKHSHNSIFNSANGSLGIALSLPLARSLARSRTRIDRNGNQYTIGWPRSRPSAANSSLAVCRAVRRRRRLAARNQSARLCGSLARYCAACCLAACLPVSLASNGRASMHAMQTRRAAPLRAARPASIHPSVDRAVESHCVAAGV